MANNETTENGEMSDSESEYMSCPESNPGNPWLIMHLPDVPQHPISDGPPTYDESQEIQRGTQHEGFPSYQHGGIQESTTAQSMAASAASGQALSSEDGIDANCPLENILDNQDLLSKVTEMLDQVCSGRKNWTDIASKYGFTYNNCKNIEYNSRGTGSCIEAVLARVVSSNPEIKVGDFVDKLREIGRNDVIDVLKEFLRRE